MGSRSHFQGIFPTQGLNPGLPHCRQILYHLSHLLLILIPFLNVFQIAKGRERKVIWETERLTLSFMWLLPLCSPVRIFLVWQIYITQNLSFYPFLGERFGEGNGNPLQYSCLENPVQGGAWWAAVHGVAKSGTRLSDFTFTFHFHALEKEMATHSSILTWRIPGTGEPGGLPSMGSHRVGHN